MLHLLYIKIQNLILESFFAGGDIMHILKYKQKLITKNPKEAESAGFIDSISMVALFKEFICVETNQKQSTKFLLW
jgi:hypothetical protein